MMAFEDFFSQYVAPIYAQSIDPQRYIAAKKHAWQFLWMFLLCVLVGLSVHWFVEDWTITMATFSISLLVSCILYVWDYPYPDFEKPSLFVYFFMFLLAGFGSVILLMAEHTNEPLISSFFGGVMLVTMVIITLAQSPHRAALTRPYEQIKTEVIDLFLKHLYPDFGFVSAQPFDSERLRQKDIIDDDFNEIQYGIALQGTLSHFDLMMQQVKLIKITRDSKGRTSRSTVFEGFLMSTQQKNNLTVPVMLRQHRGFQLQDVFWKETHRIEMEDPHFEKFFDVVSSNEFEARRLITPAMMARLIPFADGETALSGIFFDAYHSFFAVKTRQSFFEGNYANQQAVKLELQQIQEVLDKQLELVLAVTKP
jgi:hypothetical protein